MQSAYLSFESCLRSVSRETLDEAVSAVKLDDPCFMQYTSGTSGDPKGVLLTHRNIMSQQLALSSLWHISTESRFLSHLPWHHSFGGLFERFSALYNGAVLYLDDSLGKDIERLIENMSQVRPTQFFSVPRIHRALVNAAQLNPEVRDILCHPELQFIFTAAAPLPKEIGAYFKTQSIRVMEGWGLTETSPCVTLTPLDKERVHSYVGEPIPGCEILTNEESEILVRGPNVMAGYFKDPERTSDVMDSYGWFNTGDIGEITDYGLRLIGRRDGQFKLSNGERVSSTLVESALTSPSKWVQHAVALGAGEDFVAALIFPNFTNLESWAKEQGKPYSDKLDMAKDEAVQDLISCEITGNMADFASKVMTVRGFAIIPEELSMGRGELTPSMKVIRHRVTAKYREYRDAIYRESGPPDKKQYVVMVKDDDAFTW
jgi:long-subunit acyl-CoA synthetase (AMP-forming)